MSGSTAAARTSRSATEQQFLADPPRALARIATVDERGLPHVVPGQWAYDGDADELVLGGRDVLSTKRASHVRMTGTAAAVIDGVADGPGFSPWALMVRGRARIDEGAGAIRLSLDETVSWNLSAVLPEV